MTLTLKGIRSIASDHGYKEIDFNENSRLISFRGGPSQSTRINVYYTTGTVGTCMNHPKRGKTQLFRRNIQTPAVLAKIFEDPRVHTGAGYYTRKNIRQLWKKQGTDTFLRDSARRWVYVGNAVGMFKDESSEMNTVVNICTEWDDLYWEKGAIPDLKETRYACGSHGILLSLLYVIIQNEWGDFETVSRENGDVVDTERPFRHTCEFACHFLSDHLEDVFRIQQKFMSLTKHVRLELAQWFLGRDAAGCSFNDPDFNRLRTPFTDALNAVHNEYGNLVYPKKAGLCPHCGVMSSRHN